MGQPVLILKQEKGKILQNFENKVYKVISQNHTSLKLQFESGDIRYRSVCHVRPYYAPCLDKQTVSHKRDVPLTRCIFDFETRNKQMFTEARAFSRVTYFFYFLASQLDFS